MTNQNNRRKQCSNCRGIYPLSGFYKNSRMEDGYFNQCKKCVRRAKKQRDQQLKDGVLGEKERARQREKYHRLKYGDKYRPTTDQKRATTRAYRDRYPEKLKAQRACSKLKREKETVHHWSYRDQHHTDVIHLTNLQHAKIHRFITYDPVALMYRRNDNGELLTTKKQHLAYISRFIS